MDSRAFIRLNNPSVTSGYQLLFKGYEIPTSLATSKPTSHQQSTFQRTIEVSQLHIGSIAFLSPKVNPFFFIFHHLKWCRWRDLNSHDRSRGILSPLCIPIPPHRQLKVSSFLINFVYSIIVKHAQQI